MSSPFSSEHLADIRDGARRMAEQTRAHEGDLTEFCRQSVAAATRRDGTTLMRLRACSTTSREENKGTA